MQNTVGLIFLYRAPAQVFQLVVCRITVKVTALHALWTGAYKGFKDETVYVAHFIMATKMKIYLQMTTVLWCLFQYFPLTPTISS